MKNCFKILALFIFTATFVYGGNKYRTFSQYDLAMRKAKPGKALGSNVCFRFYNTTGETVNDLHGKLNASIISIEDAGGFPVFDVRKRGREFDASGMSVLPGDSVTICLTLGRKGPGAHVNFWWWTRDGEQVGIKNDDLGPISEDLIRTQPNGGNVLKYLYRRIIRRPAGLLVGLPTDTPDVGWFRYMNAQRKAFVHTGEPRCLDYLVRGSSGRVRAITRQVRNPHVKKHNNHLVGELHALKLAIVANDSGVTEPLDSLATLFGDLLYNDTQNGGDICNGMTIREIAHYADSALTYCSHFTGDVYTDLDACISRINAAFGGDYAAISFNPFILAGTVDIAGVDFLHENPSAAPVQRPVGGYSIIEEMPTEFGLEANYPNPFNPTTTIEFGLAAPSAVTLKVYNMLGEEVATLLSGDILDDGFQTADFDAGTLPSGVYVYVMTALPLEGPAAPYTSARKMILLK